MSYLGLESEGDVVVALVHPLSGRGWHTVIKKDKFNAKLMVRRAGRPGRAGDSHYETRITSWT